MVKTFSPQEFWHSSARQLLAYPSGDKDVLYHRWIELQTYGIEAIDSYGPETWGGVEILGVGYCGVVLRVRHQGKDRVLKVRREPAPQASLQTEADMLLQANVVSVGPQYIAHSDNFLLMDYIRGPMLVDWLQDVPPVLTIHNVVSNLIHQAYRLDQAGLDHGDLRCVTAHALVQDKEPVLIDFSGASLNRRPANVTTLVQGLFISTQIAQLLQRWFPKVHKAQLIEFLRQYKLQPSLSRLQSLLSYIGMAYEPSTNASVDDDR